MTDEAKSARVQLLISPSELKAVDDWAFANRIRSRNEAIRRLLALAVKTAAARGAETSAIEVRERDST